MALVDPCSPDCFKSELDFFNLDPTQTSIEETRLEEFFPLTSLDGDGQIEFKVNVGMDEFVDLNEIWLYTKCKILDGDGNALKEKDTDGNVLDGSVVFPVNYFQASMFKQIEVLLNNTLIQTGPLYPFRGYLETTLSFGSDAKSTQLKASMFEADVDNFDCVDPTKADEKNTGAKARFQRTKYSQPFECLGRIHSELFQQPKLLLNKVTLGLRLHRNTPKFILMAKDATKNYRINIEKSLLLVTVKRVASHVREAIENRLLETNAKYNLRRVEMRFFTKGAERSDISVNNLCSGTIPSQIILGMIKTNAFNGDFKSNPFRFEHFKTSEFNIIRNGVNVPFKPLSLKFQGSDTILAYFQMMHSIGLWNKNKSNGIDPFGTYLNGHTLFAVNLSQDFSNGGNLNLIQEGLISLNLRLEEAKTHSITIIVYLVYPSTVLEINQNREIYHHE